MPKKKELKNLNKKKETNLKKEWKKLRGKIKINTEISNLKEKKEEEKIEEKKAELEEIKQETLENFQEFQEFGRFIPIEISRAEAPVLKRIERPQSQENLEENIASTPVPTDVQENVGKYDSFNARADYSSLPNREDERKYESEPIILKPVRETQEFQGFRKQEFLSPFEREKIWESETDKIIDTPIRTAEEKRTLPFETEKKKYKEYKSEKLFT